MAEQNRFSILLKQLMAAAEVKNYTLAQSLQYDVSYISKWTSGQMLPSERAEKKILSVISDCLVEECDELGKNKLMIQYQVQSIDDLKAAIFNNLETEYVYVQDLQKSEGITVGVKTAFFPELTVEQFISRKHPIVRRVNELYAAAIVDIFMLERQYQIRITQTRTDQMQKGKYYPDVHYSMLIDIQEKNWDYIYDTFFLIDMVYRNSCVDFHLYKNPQSVGRAVFTVKDDYSISGMLVDREHCHCISVVISEDQHVCNTLYRNIMSLCKREQLVFRGTTMNEMLIKHDYVHSLLSFKQKWILGHMTEHFLPDDLFEEIIQNLKQQDLKPQNQPVISGEELRNIQQMTKQIMAESKIDLLIHKTALYNLVIHNEIDFYNYKVQLTAQQQICYLKKLLTMCKEWENLNVRLISASPIADISYNDRHCIFLGDTVSYIRLDGDYSKLVTINQLDVKKILEKTFDTLWDFDNNIIISDKDMIVAHIQHVLNGILTNIGEA